MTPKPAMNLDALAQAQAELFRLRHVIECACGHDGKLTSDDCPYHGTTFPPFNALKIRLEAVERENAKFRAVVKAATKAETLLRKFWDAPGDSADGLDIADAAMELRTALAALGDAR